MMPTFNKSARKELSRLIRKSAAHCKAGLIALLEQQTRKAPVKPMKKARLAKQKQKRLTKKEETARIRAEVFARAGNKCEAWIEGVFGDWYRCERPATDLDHWLGGNGRRRQLQSVKTTWALCRACHRDRTLARPSAAYWNVSAGLHSEKHGYNLVPHIEHAPLLKSSTPSVPAAGSPLPAKGIGGVDSNQEQLSEKGAGT